LYEHHRGRTEAQHTLHGLCTKFPIHAKNMKWSQLSLAGWGRLKPSKPKCPMPWNITCLLAHTIMTIPNKLTYFARLQTAIGLLVCWTGLLRKGELCSIKAKDIIHFPKALTGRTKTPTFVFNLALKKTKRGNDRTAIIDDEVVIALLQYLINLLPDKDKPLFPIYSTINYRIQHAIDYWNTDPDNPRLPNFTCHSLRHGGATHMWNVTRDMEYVLFRGRWAASSSAKHYIHDGMAWMEQIDAEVLEVADMVANPSNLFDNISQHHNIVGDLSDLF